MTCEITFHQTPAYLHAIVTGLNSRENVQQYLRDVLRECAARKCSRVLIEERLEGPRLGMPDVFQIASEGSDNARGMLKSVAYVDVNAANDLMKFAETVAFNRGLPAAVFPTVAVAEKWLLHEARRDAGAQGAN